MSERGERTRDSLAEYERMTADELAAVLRSDLEAENNSGLDSETLLYVMKLYARKQPDKPPKTVDEAYAEFQRDYMLRLLKTKAAHEEAEKHRRKTRRWRFVTTAAAMITLVLCAGLCVRAGITKGGPPIFRQNRDYLMISGAHGEETVHNVPQIAQQCFPQWIPEGYERMQTRHSDESYTAIYCRGEQLEEDCLTVTFRSFGSRDRRQFYKNAPPAETFIHDGVRFYRYTNARWNCVVGYSDGVLFSMTAKLSDEEIVRIVRSMEIRK